MSEGGEDWGPPSPKQRRLDPACQLQKETEAAQALAEMTAWGGGSFEVLNQQEAPASSAAKPSSLETAGQQGVRETAPAVGERSASGQALGTRYGRAGGDREASSDEEQGTAAGGVETARLKRRNAEAAAAAAAAALPRGSRERLGRAACGRGLFPEGAERAAGDGPAGRREDRLHFRGWEPSGSRRTGAARNSSSSGRLREAFT